MKKQKVSSIEKRASMQTGTSQTMRSTLYNIPVLEHMSTSLEEKSYVPEGSRRTPSIGHCNGSCGNANVEVRQKGCQCVPFTCKFSGVFGVVCGHLLMRPSVQ